VKQYSRDGHIKTSGATVYAFSKDGVKVFKVSKVSSSSKANGKLGKSGGKNIWHVFKFVVNSSKKGTVTQVS